MDQVLVLNLDRRKDRLARAHTTLLRAGLPGRQFVARDGQTLLPFEVAWHNRLAVRPLSPGLVGNFLSHLSVWQHVVDMGYERVWVLEDDVEFLVEGPDT